MDFHLLRVVKRTPDPDRLDIPRPDPAAEVVEIALAYPEGRTGEDAGPVNSFAKGNLLDSIKAKSTMINNETVDASTGEIGKITADVQSAKLKQLLGQIKQS
jgi:hypothetical protein